MRKVPKWLMFICSGAFLFGTASSSCVPDTLRDLADEIEEQEDDPDMGDVWDDIESWF